MNESEELGSLRRMGIGEERSSAGVLGEKEWGGVSCCGALEMDCNERTSRGRNKYLSSEEWIRTRGTLEEACGRELKRQEG